MAIDGFQRVLDRIRATADSEAAKGRLFERLMKAFFEQDPLYGERFSSVRLWSEWAAGRPGFDGADIGIDLVAEERAGGVCAIQCKCHAPDTRMSKAHVDSFIAASSRDPFTARILVDTGAGWGPNAGRIVAAAKPVCQTLRFDDLAGHPFDWPDLVRAAPEDLRYLGAPFALRRHQRRAFADVTDGFRAHDRGKLVMACGTGKTFAALRIAEAVAGAGGGVLYLVPSISLFAQAMREWAMQRAIPHRYVGVCSDASAGRSDEDLPLHELEIPVTTDPAAISQALRSRRASGREGAMTVVFCTYQSLELVARAQDEGAPPFDLALCDEAHRTTGVDRPGDRTSPFVLVHDAGRIRARKRLYMTATPRLYTAGAKAKAARRDAEAFSMDDPATFGPELHRLPFSRAVEQGLLSDYKVAILAVSERAADAALRTHLAAADGGELNIDDAAKIVGCWRALQNPENSAAADRPGPLRRAIAFTATIAASRRLDAHWADVTGRAAERLPWAERAAALRCETRHVDGTTHALERKARIDWLKDGAADGCRILSNARCLTEGVDVPALDAVLFMSPRNSHIDIVQAVGRVMRKAEGKAHGYVVLPVAVPAEADPARALDDNARFAVVWSVLNALRSHDDRLDAEIARIDLNDAPGERIIFGGDGAGGEDGGAGEGGEGAAALPFPPFALPPEAIYAKLVEKCGDRRYWESWARDVADIFARLVLRIEGLLETPGNAALREWFDAFHGELRESINESIPRAGAIAMMAQHIVTRPVFEALFAEYDFAGGNPVARALDSLRGDFGEFGLENETRDLQGFYDSVRARARGLDNSAARQRVTMELYEKFFAAALKKDADRLGIVYTPVEAVDFVLHSADAALRREFGRGLGGAGVHVLDPFTGTGIFLVRLLQSAALVADSDLERTYREELHANELVLLAYYMAAVHIEEALRGRRGPGAGHEPFAGIALTDTFNLRPDRGELPKVWLPDNSVRVERQQAAPIQVVVGNPPWRAGQRSAADDNPNAAYPALEARIAETYAARSTATLKNSLYDTYKMAIRWASDRIGREGVVAFVTNGSWVDGAVDSGMRACLAEEFSTIYVVNLRGNLRTQGERARREGGNVFNVRASVAITVFIRNPDAAHDGCRIFYRDVGDYRTREEKLAFLRDAGSIDGVDDWEEIEPDVHHDWIGQRDSAFRDLYPLGSKEAKAGKAGETVFTLFANGYKTGRDAYMTNFSRAACADNARAMVRDYAAALRERAESGGDLDSVALRHSARLRWDDKLKQRLQRKAAARFDDARIRKIAYRPFVASWCYADDAFAQRPARTGEMFPGADNENRAICLPGIGSTKPFSALMVDVMPDLHFISFGQCFPRYRYRPRPDAQGEIPGVGRPLERIDNVPDAALRAFRARYADNGITKDAVFDYAYGVLHAPDFRARFANDLAKDLPRIPFAADFHAFAEAGRALAALHLGYETGPEYPLEVEFSGAGAPRPEDFRLGARAMRFLDAGRSALRVNDLVTLRGVPPQAHAYVVNGRTPLEWLIDRYRIVRDASSGIVNDPNPWFAAPHDLLAAIRRVVHVSVETARIVAGLPGTMDGA